MITTLIHANAPESLTYTSPPSIDKNRFRETLSQLAAGVTIVTTSDQLGNIYGLTATAVTALSLDPPLLLICIDNHSRVIAPLQSGAGFIVHFLAADQQWIARQFARPLSNKFAEVAYQMTARGYPRIDGALASVECAPHADFPGGDHTIVVGRVVDLQVGGDGASSLLYFRRQFHHLAQETSS